MSNIPKVEYDMIIEACNKILKQDLTKMNKDDLEAFIQKNDDIFKGRQPHIHSYIHKLLDLHLDSGNYYIPTAQIVIYIMIVIDSFYAQEETEEVRKLFED